MNKYNKHIFEGLGKIKEGGGGVGE
jgi:hypothetical protein